MPRQHWLEIMISSWKRHVTTYFQQSLKDWIWNHPAHAQVQRYAEPVLLVCALNVAFECVCTDSRHQLLQRGGYCEGRDIFCWTLVLLSDSIRRMFWEWAHACVKVTTFTTIIRPKLPKWYENSCSQLYILIDTHILKYFLNGPNNLSFQNSRRAFHRSEWFSKPQKRSSDKEVDLLCCWLWKVIGSHHRPYNLQYSCCIWLTSECSTRFLGSTFPCFPLTDIGWCRCLLGPSRDVVEPWQFV